VAILAAGLLLASIFSPLARDAGDAYDDAEVETPTEASPTESLLSEPHAYLYAAYPRYARRLDCVIGRESRWNTTAYNSRSGATGLAQFIYSTWMSTPQGKAGASRTDPIASIDASVFLIEQTPQSWHHWTTIGLC
jgi:soluble lytic murein transglycosylase-like protein